MDVACNVHAYRKLDDEDADSMCDQNRGSALSQMILDIPCQAVSYQKRQHVAVVLR